MPSSPIIRRIVATGLFDQRAYHDGPYCAEPEYAMGLTGICRPRCHRRLPRLPFLLSDNPLLIEGTSVRLDANWRQEDASST